MANQEHLEILKKGVAEWNRWRAEHPKEKPDLRAADLHNVNLSDANMFDADLRLANLSGAALWGANLRAANLEGATLDGADCLYATLIANLVDASLQRVSLKSTNLSGAYLSGADFSRAIAGWTIFSDVDLSVAKGLETIERDGPSTVGIDTIYRSRGNIPEAFLRGAGVPDNFITYIGSLIGKPIEFYSCFVSYSTRDQEFAERLHADLQARGVRCWFAPHDIAGGKKIHEQIDEAIRMHDRLLLILSSASKTSKWVKTEISRARKREEKEQRRVLFPVRLVDFQVLREWECFDADIGIDSAAEVREYFIPDFSRWKNHDSYQNAFERLLRDLKAEAQKP